MKNLILSVSFLLVSISVNATNKVPNVELSKIVYVQNGVTNYEGITGMYIYYRLPSDGNFNVDKHRKFISKLDYFKLVNNK